MMKCFCCLSDKIQKHPMKLSGYHGCGSCGLIFKNQINEKNNREEYRKHYQQTDPHQQVAQSKQHFFNRALDILSEKIEHPKKTILDVGCGYGYFLELAVKRGWRVSGVEIMESAVRQARDKLGSKGIFHGVLEKANHEDDAFDAITLWDLLDFVSDPFKELDECYRVLKKGGMIGIRVRNVRFQKMVYRIFSIFKIIAWVLGIKPPYVFHPYCYTGRSLAFLLERVGFTHIRISHSPLTRGDPYTHTSCKGLTSIFKRGVETVSKCLFSISGGRWVAGPSLLVWAEKPLQINKTNQLA